MQQLNLVLFKITEKCSFRNELISQVGKSHKYDLSNYQSVRDVKLNLSKQGHGIVVFHIKNKTDLKEVVSLLRSLKGLQRKKLLKTVCILGKRNNKVEDVLRRYGCHDVLELTTSCKCISHKIDFLSHSLIKELEENQRTNNFKSAKSNYKKENLEKKDDFVQVDPLEIESDCWVISSSADYKRILKTYLIRIIGPSPHIGKWIELEGKSNVGLKKDEFSTWEFILNDKNDKSFVRSNGSWFFYGSKPDFDWKVQRWRFSSERPHLYFSSDSNEVVSKIEYTDGQVELANNSKYALSLKDKILQTCSSDFNFSRDKEKKDKEKTLSENKELEGKLKGKGQTEHLGDNKLKGKSSTNDIDSGPLSGRVENSTKTDNPLDGELGTDKLTNDPLSNKKNKTDDLSTNPLVGDVSNNPQGQDLLDGKLSTDKLTRDPLSNKKNKTQDLSSDPLARDVNSKAGGQDELDGKLGTDKLTRDPLSNKKNKMQNPIAAPLIGDISDENKKEEALAGAFGTDKITRDPLSNKEKTKSNPRSDDMKGHVGAATKEKEDHASKAKTDRINRDPLSNKMNDESKEDSLDGQVSKAKNEDSLSGKARTDNIKNDPLSNSRSALEKKQASDLEANVETQAQTKDPLSGKGEADNVDKDPLSIELDQPDDVSSDPLAGKIDNSVMRDPLAGIAAMDVLNRDPLSNKKNKEGQEGKDALTSKGIKKKKDLGKGKGKTDQIVKKPLSGKVEKSRETSSADLLETAKEKELSSSDIVEQLEAQAFNNKLDSKEVSKPYLSDSESNDKELADKKNKTKWNNPIEKKINENSQDKKQDLKQDFSDKVDPATKKEEAEYLDASLAVKEKKQEGSQASSDAPFLSDLIDKSQDPESNTLENLSGIEKSKDIKGDALDSLPIIKKGISNTVDENLEDISSIESTDSLSLIEEVESPEVNLESGKVTAYLSQSGKEEGDVTSLCEFVELYEDELTVIAPLSVMFLDQKISARVNMEYSGEQVEVNCSGVILEHEEIDDEKVLVVIDIKKLVKQEYESFLTLYEQRQLNINDFMKLAKGY